MNYQEYSDSELCSMICENSDEAKEILYSKYKYILDVIIKKYVYTAKKFGIEYNDLYQEGLVGFADALNHYDETKNVKLATFLSLCIERRFQNAVLKAGRLKNKILLESLSLDHTYGEQQVPLSEMICDASSDPLFGISKQEDYNELLEKIKNELSSSEFEVYQLLINGLNYQEISFLLNKKPKQVDNTIQRLKHKIKVILNGEDFS